jgi:hypothetical protein
MPQASRVPFSRYATTLRLSCRAKKTSTEMLVADSSFNKCRDFLQVYDASEFFKCFAQSKPSLRVLELGAASGGATVGI